MTGKASEPIAVVAATCRLPGSVRDLDGFWKLLAEGRDVVTEMPGDRFDVDTLFDPDPQAEGRSWTRWGGFLDDLRSFDPALFGISPREAMAMDPQQRMLLEMTWEVLEAAGIPPSSRRGSGTGVFIGTNNNDFQLVRGSRPDFVDAHSPAGMHVAVLANRIGHLFDFQGPNLTLDTACSASLVAVHLAMRALRNGETDLAVAGGVNLLLAALPFVGTTKARMVSPTGRSRAFDKGADGYVRAEGGGLVLLQRLSDALASRAPILGVLRGSAIGQDGATSGISAPNGLAQERLYRTALEDAGIEPPDVTLVEAHGTGTVVGDSTELGSLTSVYSQGELPCSIGSLKTNLGHLEGAAGIAGLLKVLLCLRHGEVPPHLHFTELPPDVSLDGTRFQIQTETVPWDVGKNSRIAAVSAFGFGGALAHVLVSEPPPAPPAAPTPWSGGLLCFSGHTPAALQARAETLRRWLPSTEAPPADLAWTSAATRESLRYRGAVFGMDATDWAEALELWQTDVPVRPEEGGIAFVYSGQGPQWWAMGRELLDTDQLFRAAVERCDVATRRLGGHSILDALLASEESSRLSETVFAQPALIAIQIGLTERLRAWGIEPGAVVGHSLGEVTAAWAAGALTLEQSMEVIQARVRMMAGMTDLGAMGTVRLPWEEVERLVTPTGSDGPSEICIASYNGPEDVTLSGDPSALEALLQQLEERGELVRRMRVRYAFHSPQMDVPSRRLAEELADLEPCPPTIPIFSSVRGDRSLDGDWDATYHARNVREPVRFAQAVQEMIRQGWRSFVEIAPHPVLSGYVDACLSGAGAKGIVVPTLRRGEPERAALEKSFGALWAAGHSLDPKAVLAPAAIAPLPPVTLMPKELWFDDDAPQATARGGRPSPHPRLSVPLEVADGRGATRRVWTVNVGAEGFYRLSEHRVRDRVVLPGAAIVDLALAAARHGIGAPHTLEALELIEPVELPAGGTRELQISAGHASGAHQFELVARDGDGWRVHARGSLQPMGSEPPRPLDLIAIRGRCPDPVDPEVHRSRMATSGLTYGPAYSPLQEIHRGDGEAIARLTASPEVAAEAGRCEIHPGLLDGAFQLLAVARTDTGGDTWLPVRVGEVTVYGPTSEESYAWLTVEETEATDERAATLAIAGPDGEVRVLVRGLVVRRVSAVRTDHLDALVAVGWTQARAPTTRTTFEEPGHWLVMEDRAGRARRLADSLRQRGEQISLLPAGAPLDAEPEPEEGWRGVVWAAALDDTQGEPDAEQERILLPALELVRSLASRQQPPEIWLLTRRVQSVGVARTEPEGAGLWGLGRTIRAEFPTLRGALADLDRCDEEEMAVLAQQMLDRDGEDQLAIRGTSCYVARVEPLPPPEAETSPAAGRRYELVAERSRIFEQMHLRACHRSTPPPWGVEVEIEAAGLNFLDVLATLGMIPASLLGDATNGPQLGQEALGRVSSLGADATGLEIGERVMGLFLHSAFKTHALTHPGLLWPVPEGLSSVEAVTTPLTFLTAWESLVRAADLQPGERVLIHAATGGVGMAALQVARHLGAEIYATAGTEAKRSLLREMGVAGAFDSRSDAFVDGVLEVTNGEGVDVVLNSLAEPLLSASFGLLRHDGRFIEIGKRDYLADNTLGLRPFLKRLSFELVDLLSITRTDPESLQARFTAMLPLFESGALRPLPRTVFPAERAGEAFETMARAEHVGKLVLSFEGDPHVKPALGFGPDASVLITGGLGGLGLEVARWLAETGSPHLWLLGRSVPDAARRVALDELRAAGASVDELVCDVGNAASLNAALASIRRDGPPLRAVVHAAGVLEDATLASLDADASRRVLSAKVGGAWNLHRATLADPLEAFVLFSSVAGLIGSPGQAPYAAANALLDGLAQSRRDDGRPGLSIAWSAWGGVGMAAKPELLERMVDVGIVPIEPELGARTFGALTAGGSPPVVGVLPVRWARWAERSPERARQPLFERLVPEIGAGSDDSVLAQLEPLSADERRELVRRQLLEQLAVVLRLPVSRLEPGLDLLELGMDSLMTFELRSRLEGAFELSLPASMLTPTQTPLELADWIRNQLEARLGPSRTPAVDPTAVDPSAVDPATLSDAQVEQMLESLQKEGR